MDLLRILWISLAQIIQPQSSDRLGRADQWRYSIYALEPKLDEGVIEVLPLIQPLQVASCDVHRTCPGRGINKKPSTIR